MLILKSASWTLEVASICGFSLFEYNILFSVVLQSLFLLQTKIFFPWTVRAAIEHALLTFDKSHPIIVMMSL